MKRFACILILSILAAPMADAFEAIRPFPALDTGENAVEIVGSADLDAMAPVIAAFQRQHRDIRVRYTQGASNEVYRTVARRALHGYDLVISSAMDLQVKLVNDGYARTYQSRETARLPAWARWRDRVFAFTLEPAVIVYDTRQFEDGEVPDTRFDLIQFLRDHPKKFAGRIATYDVETSGLGYLFASQDSIRSSTWWRLMEVAGGLGTRLSCCSGEMLDWIERGEVALVYNVLGSYALARKERGAPIGIILPADYTLTMARSALITRDAPRPRTAEQFIDFLLSPAGQRVVTRTARLNGILAGNEDPNGIFSGFSGQLAPISFGPGLLVFLDRAKRKRFIADWRNTVRKD